MLARFDHRTPTWFPLHVWGNHSPGRRYVQRHVEKNSDAARQTAKAATEPRVNVLFDIYENKDAYVLRADVPGVKKSELEINVEDKSLTVSGERKNDDNDNEPEGATRLRSQERRHGKFSRTFRLNDAVDPDAISAELSNGVLTLTVPKPAEAKPRTIPITVK
jgi:HSP20 family protein